MRDKKPASSVATVAILALVLGHQSVGAAGTPLERVRLGLTKQTPIADSARSVGVARDVEIAQYSQPRPSKGVRCAVGLTLFPLMGTFLGMLVGATGALATGNAGESAEGPITGATVAGAALGIGLGLAVCLK